MITFQALGEESWPWVKATTHLALSEQTRGIVAVDGTGEYVGCVVFDNWMKSSVNVHLALDNPMALRRGLFQEAAQFVFETCEKEVMVSPCSADDERANKIVARAGFTEAARIKDGWDFGTDMIIYKMAKADCRWLGRVH